MSSLVDGVSTHVVAVSLTESATAVCVMLLLTEVPYTLWSQSWKPVASIFFWVVFS